MQIPDLKQLDKLIALCRKRGVKVVKLGDMELTLSDDIPVTKHTKKEQISQSQDFVSDTLSHQELLDWSSVGVPGDKDEQT